MDRRRAPRQAEPRRRRSRRLLHDRAGDAGRLRARRTSTPNDGIFSCDPKNVYVLKKDYGKGVTLADVGKSMSDLK